MGSVKEETILLALGRSMAYLDEINRHWANCIEFSRRKKATTLQLNVLRRLAASEFGEGSDMRLRHDCFWSTTIDSDGDVVLSFIHPPFNNSPARVNVYIDHTGVLSIRDMLSGNTVMFDQNLGGDATQWVLNSEMFKPFTESGLLQTTLTYSQGLLIADTGQVVWPFIAVECHKDEVAVSPGLNHEHAVYVQVRGYLHFAQLIYRDPISLECLYAVHRLSPWQKGRVYAHEFAAKIMNRIRGKRSRTKYSVEGFDADLSFYCVL